MHYYVGAENISPLTSQIGGQFWLSQSVNLTKLGGVTDLNSLKSVELEASTGWELTRLALAPDITQAKQVFIVETSISSLQVQCIDGTPTKKYHINKKCKIIKYSLTFFIQNQLYVIMNTKNIFGKYIHLIVLGYYNTVTKYALLNQFYAYLTQYTSHCSI